MLIYNLDRSDVPSDVRLVNGSRGVVCELVNFETCRRELEEDDRARDAAVAAASTALDARGQAAAKLPIMNRSSVLKQYCDNLRTKTQGINSLFFPRVRFVNGVCKVMGPCCFNQTLYDGGYVFRLQLPIKCSSLFHSHFITSPPHDHSQVGLVSHSAQGPGCQHRFFGG